MHYDRLTQFRCRSVQKAHAAGIPAFFMDDFEGVVRVLPNGQKDRIIIAEGRSIVQPINYVRTLDVGLG